MNLDRFSYQYSFENEVAASDDYVHVVIENVVICKGCGAVYSLVKKITLNRNFGKMITCIGGSRLIMIYPFIRKMFNENTIWQFSYSKSKKI